MEDEDENTVDVEDTMTSVYSSVSPCSEGQFWCSEVDKVHVPSTLFDVVQRLTNAFGESLDI